MYTTFHLYVVFHIVSTYVPYITLRVPFRGITWYVLNKHSKTNYTPIPLINIVLQYDVYDRWYYVHLRTYVRFTKDNRQTRACSMYILHALYSDVTCGYYCYPHILSTFSAVHFRKGYCVRTHSVYTVCICVGVP